MNGFPSSVKMFSLQYPQQTPDRWAMDDGIPTQPIHDEWMGAAEDDCLAHSQIAHDAI